eukprot:Pgem_evm1s2
MSMVLMEALSRPGIPTRYIHSWIEEWFVLRYTYGVEPIKGNFLIKGGSAGGMAVGYMINKYPSWFKGALGIVPFVDVLNTMLDSSLPLTPLEYKEWGNPSSSREFFNYILSYSPYENITRQNYPNIFFTAGMSDPRVGYWEPAKYIAKTRVMNTNQKALIMLKTEMDFGHGGASKRDEAFSDVIKKINFHFKNK